MIRAIALPLDAKELEASFAEQVQAILPLAKDAGSEAAMETFTYLREYTGQMRPPDRRRGPDWREAHAGGWADVTFQLMNSYVLDILPLAMGWEFVLDIAEPARQYAVIVEEMDGFWVLSGVTIDGGMFDQKLAAAAAKFGFEVQNMPGPSVW